MEKKKSKSLAEFLDAKLAENSGPKTSKKTDKKKAHRKGPAGKKTSRFQPKKEDAFVKDLKQEIKSRSRRSYADGEKVEGVVKRHPDGFGFFIANDPEHPDVYIPRHDMRGVMTNDRVRVSCYPDKKQPDRLRGEIDEILGRGVKKVLGVYVEISEAEGRLVDESHSWGEDLVISKANAAGAEHGQLVSAEITEYPGKGQTLQGKIIDVIGDGEDPLNDIKRVAFDKELPQEFSAKAIKEADRFTPDVEEKEWKDRKDLREMPFVTIDGVTAKDFDDAICVQAEDRGFRLWVAIADVSHYVKPGMAIDEDAYERGTSVYFPGHVFPMLPEILSNELCSLRPGIPRLALVCEMQIDYAGEVQKYEFYEAVIKSHSRVTYGEAQELIDGENIEKHAHVKEAILRAADLSKILMAKRFREGSLNLEIPETEVEINEAGIPVDILRSDRIFAHKLIEELMLIANVSAAKFFDERELPAIYRIHESPNKDAIQVLENYLYNFGHKHKFGGGKLQKKLTEALKEFEGTPQAQILNILALRSMSQAQYSANNVGHFGLGFDFYSHFTSPIRRYPDLIVHRLIKSQVTKNSSYQAMSEEDLQSAGTILSACEQRAVKAERQLISIKKARFMESFVGQEFEGMISSVAKFGVFVILRQYDVDGRVALEDLGGDYWEFDEETLQLTGKKSGFVYKIGDPLTVQVSAVDPEEGKIDFVLSELPELGLPERKKKKSKGKPGLKGKKKGQGKSQGKGQGKSKSKSKGKKRRR